MRLVLATSDVQTKGAHLAQLVTYKAVELGREYDGLIRDAIDVSTLVSMAESDVDALALRKLAASHVYAQAAGFRRRILEPTGELPLLLLRLAESDCNTSCDARKRVAALVLDTSDEQLDPVSKKIKHLCDADLRQAEATDTTGMILYSITQDMRRRLTCSVAPNETLNSQLKRMIEKSRNISQMLLNARLGIKYFIGKTDICRDKTQINTMPALTAMGAALLKTCMDVKTSRAAKGIHGLQAELQVVMADRWAPAPVVPVKPLPKDITQVDIAYGKSFELTWRTKCLDLINDGEPVVIELCNKKNKGNT